MYLQRQKSKTVMFVSSNKKLYCISNNLRMACFPFSSISRDPIPANILNVEGFGTCPLISSQLTRFIGGVLYLRSVCVNCTCNMYYNLHDEAPPSVIGKQKEGNVKCSNGLSYPRTHAICKQLASKTRATKNTNVHAPQIT